MPRFVIERDMPGVGSRTPADLKPAVQKSCSALNQLGPKVQWLQSYVTPDRIYCIYLAPDEAAIREHARLSGIVASRVSRVSVVLDPTSAD